MFPAGGAVVHPGGGARVRGLDRPRWFFSSWVPSRTIRNYLDPLAKSFTLREQLGAAAFRSALAEERFLGPTSAFGGNAARMP